VGPGARVVLTGGAGFIGSHVLQALLHRGASVAVVDDLNDFYDPAEKRRNLAEADPDGRSALLLGDIRDDASWEGAAAAIGRPTHVVHLAARAGVRPSLLAPDLYHSVNVSGTERAVAWALAWGGVPTIVASSSSIYGDDNPVPFAEDATPRPISPYGASKVAAEAVLRRARDAHGLPTVALRFFTVYGPRQRPDLAIRSFTTRLLRGEPLTLFGDGSAARDHTHVDDIVRGVLAVLDRLDQGQPLAPAYNLGSDRAISLTDLVARIEHATGRRATLTYAPVQDGDVRRTWADLRLAERDLGYRPQVDLRRGLDDVVRWLREAPPVSRG
jgi:UDP-glucuronate 4-epimerase